MFPFMLPPWAGACSRKGKVKEVSEKAGERMAASSTRGSPSFPGGSSLIYSLESQVYPFTDDASSSAFPRVRANLLHRLEKRKFLLSLWLVVQSVSNIISHNFVSVLVVLFIISFCTIFLECCSSIISYSRYFYSCRTWQYYLKYYPYSRVLV